MKKILTVITVCYNSEKTIERCIKSLIEQWDERIEYIVVDGKSKDHTMDIVDKYSNYIKSISEKDNGIYDAMNKGVKMSSGEWILFMNSDDCFLPNSVNNLLHILEQNNSYDMIYSDIEEATMFGDELYTRIYHSSSQLSLMKKDMIMRHQAVIVKRTVFEELNYFDLNFKLAADWEFLLRIYLNNYKILQIHDLFSRFYFGGASFKFHTRERHNVRKKNKCYSIIDIEYIKDSIHSLELRKRFNLIFDKKNVEKNFLDRMGFKKNEKN